MVRSSQKIKEFGVAFGQGVLHKPGMITAKFTLLEVIEKRRAKCAFPLKPVAFHRQVPYKDSSKEVANLACFSIPGVCA